MNRAIKEATVKRYLYDNHRQLQAHLTDFFKAHKLQAAPQHAQWPYALRVHLQNLDKRASSVQVQSAPQNAGIKYLARRAIPSF